MPTVQFQCGQCGNSLEVDSELLGTAVQCPFCRQVVPTPLRPLFDLIEHAATHGTSGASDQATTIPPAETDLETQVPAPGQTPCAAAAPEEPLLNPFSMAETSPI